jgi:hypothetical protein
VGQDTSKDVSKAAPNAGFAFEWRRIREGFVANFNLPQCNLNDNSGIKFRQKLLRAR